MTTAEKIRKLFNENNTQVQEAKTNVGATTSATASGIGTTDKIAHLFKTGKPMDADYFNTEFGKIPDFIKTSAEGYENYGYSSGADVYNNVISNVGHYRKVVENAKAYNPEHYEKNKSWYNDIEEALGIIEQEYTGKHDLFGRFATEDEYNTEIARQERVVEKETKIKDYEKYRLAPESEFDSFSQKGNSAFTVNVNGSLYDIAQSYNAERQKEGFDGQNKVALFWSIVEKYPELLKDGVSIYDVEGGRFIGGEYLDYFITSMKQGFNVPIRRAGRLTESATIYVAQMDESQRDMYNYLYETQGVDAADEYLALNAELLSEKQGMADFAALEGKPLKEFFYGFKAGAKQWEAGFVEFLGGLDSEYATHDPSHFTSQKIKEDLGGFGNFLFDLSSTTGNQLPSMVVSGLVGGFAGDKISAATSGVMMGGSAAGGAYTDALNMGYSQKQAQTYGFLVGAAEGILEALMDGATKAGGLISGNAIKKLSSKVASGIGKFAIKMGGKMLSEGIEEYLAEVLDTAWRNYAFDTNEDLDWFSSDAFYAALLGAVSAGLMGGGNVASDIRFETARDELINLGKNLPSDSKAYQLATKLEKNKYKLKPEQLQELSNEINQTIAESNREIFQNIRDTLVFLGEKGDVNAIASAAVNAMNGAPLTQTEKDLINNSVIAPTEFADGQNGTTNASDTEGNTDSGVDGDMGVDSGFETYQNEVMAEFPENVLNMAFGYAGNGNDVKAIDIGIDPQSEFYKKLESAGLADSNGMINGAAILDEVKRRAEIPKAHVESDGKTVIDLSDDSELMDLIANKHGSERYNIIKEYILGSVQGQPVTLSDGKEAYIDKSDAKHIARNAGNKKASQISKIKEIIETAQLVAEETSAKDKKFDYFYYYEAFVKCNGDTFPVYLNVGRAKNDGKYHIYDITQKLRDTAHRVNDVGRPVGDALENGVSNNNIPDSSENVKENADDFADMQSVRDYIKAHPEYKDFNGTTVEQFKEYKEFIDTIAEDSRNLNGEDLETGGFTDAPDSEIQRERTFQDEAFDSATGKYRTPKQRQAESVAKLFGIKLWWDDNLTAPYYNFETHCIFMNPKLTISDMYAAIFKHELVHHFELKKGYDGFKNYLFKNSPAFAQYCYDCLDLVSDTAFDGTYEEAIEAYTKYKLEQYKNSSEIPEGLRDRFTAEMAEMEIVADFVGERLLFGKNVDKSMEALTEIAKTDRNLFQRIWDWVKDKLKALKKRGDVQNRSLEKDLDYLEKRLARVWDSKDKKNSTANVGVKYFAASKNENSSIKQQLREHSSEVNAMQPVANIEYTPTSKKNLRIQAVQEFKKIGYAVDRQNFGVIEISEKHINQGLDYINTESEKAALLAVPKVLKRGIDISGHDNHKGRSYGTVTIAAPVSINGKIGNVAVVVKMTGRNRYSTHRILMPDGSEFVFEQNKDAEPTSSDMLATESDQGTDIGSASNNNIPNPNENVKHYLGFNKDGEVDFVAPKKLSVKERVDRMTKRFGKYETGNKGLSQDISEVLRLAKEGELIEAASLAKEIAQRFKGVDGQSVNTDAVLRYINNAIISYQVEYQHSKDVVRLNEKIEQRDQRIRELEGKEVDSHRYHEQMEKKRLDREDRAKNLKNFRSVYNRLNTLLNANSDARHVPEHLKKVIGSFLDTFRSGNIEVDGKWQRRRLLAKDIGDLIRHYEKVEFDANGTPNMAYDESIIEFLDELCTKAENSEKGLLTQDLDAYDVLMLSNVADNLMQMVRLAEETFREGKATKFQDLSEPCINELKQHKNKKEVRSKAAGWLNNLKSGNMTPPYFFKKLGEGFYRLYNDIVEGQGKWALHFNAAKKFVEGIQEKYNYSKWKDKTVVLHTERGQDIKLTIEQAMQLYATVKRQIGNRKQDAQHLNIGGIVLEDSIDSSNWKKIKSDLETINNDDKLNDEQKSNKIKEVWNAFYDVFDKGAVQLSINDLMSVKDLLDTEQVKYTEAWVSYLSNNMAALGNETSMLLFGYEKFTESNYIPYNSAENYLYSQPGAVKGDERIKHLSFTKNTQKKAATPLVLSSLSEVCAAHVDKMCMYNAMAVPLENLNKVFNCTLYDEVGTPTENVKQELERAFGPEAVKYLKRFIDDANGSVRSSSDDSTADLWISRYKKGSVLASLSVVVQQPSALFRAMAYIDSKYFFKVKDVKGIGKNYEQLCKYAPVALIKQMGRFDTGLGVSNTKWLLGQKTLMDKLDDKMSLLASKADEMAWSQIWTAVKAEAAATTNMKVGSEEFLQHCGKRFTEVINLTQVYDSTLVKSQHMRDKSAYKKMLTSFMAEPTVTFNILADAIYRFAHDSKAGKRFALRAGRSVAISIIVNVMLKSLVYAARDDDEDKSYWEKYCKELAENIVDEVNPLNMIPFIRDVWSLIQGYDVERADMTMIDNLISSFEMMGSDNKTFYEKAESLAGSIANVFGIPLKNVIRDINAIANVISGGFDFDYNDTTLTGVKYAVIEGFTGKSSDASYYDRMAEAVEDGDEETYEELFDLMLENGVEENDIISGVKSAIKKSDAVESEADKYVKNASKNSTYKMLDENDRKKFASKIKEVLCAKALDDMIPGSDSQYDKLYEAKRTNSNRFKKLKAELTDKGISESDIDFNLFLAEIRYLESKGINIGDWALAELAKSKKYADADGSGGVSKKEARQAIENMDIDKETKKDLWSYYGIG